MVISLTDRLQYESLKAQLIYHKHRYYVLNDPEITDHEYDGIEKQFDALANKLSLPGSWVGVKS